MTEISCSTNKALKISSSCELDLCSNDWLSKILSVDNEDVPPWKNARTVIACNAPQSRDGGRFACAIHPGYYVLKTRLTPIEIRSRHSRQRLYLDAKTGQHWLSIRVSIRRRDETRELLKPVSVDVANSLRCPS